MEVITSRGNPLVAQIRKLNTSRSFRREQGLFVCDGPKLLGEALACEAMVEVDGAKGMAVTLGDDFDKVLDMAVLDAAFNRKVPQCAAIQQELYRLEEEQRRAEEQENGLYHRTQVHFESLDSEVPHEDHP